MKGRIDATEPMFSRDPKGSALSEAMKGKVNHAPSVSEGHNDHERRAQADGPLARRMR